MTINHEQYSRDFASVVRWLAIPMFFLIAMTGIELAVVMNQLNVSPSQVREEVLKVQALVKQVQEDTIDNRSMNRNLQNIVARDRFTYDMMRDWRREVEKRNPNVVWPELPPRVDTIVE